MRRLRLIERIVAVLREPPTSYSRWKKLILDHGISGVQAHDARIVASTIAHRVRRLLTLNERDFLRFDEVEVLTPATVPHSRR